MGEGGCTGTLETGGSGAAANGERRATGDSLRGCSGELAFMKFVICVRSGLRRGASTFKWYFFKLNEYLPYLRNNCLCLC